jgi:hypothetical protein
VIARGYPADGRALRVEAVINDPYDLGCQRLWVPSTVSRRLTSGRPAGHGPQPDQHDRLLWPSDSRT